MKLISRAYSKLALSFLGVALCSSSSLTTVAHAEDINEIFKRVNEYVAKENYTKALEELSWAKKEIEKQNSSKIAKLLPEEISGFKGSEAKVTNALGMLNLEKTYKAEGKEIQLSLTGGAGGAGDSMGGLSGLARMGMMMDASQGGSETFRIDGRTASLKTEGTRPELTIILESGSMLKLEARKGVDAAALKTFGETMKLAPLDTYLKGAQ